MAYRNHCNTLTAWHYTGGRNHLVGDLIRDGSGHAVEIWGNSRDGFEPYIVNGGSGVSLSSGPFTLRRDCVAACERMYNAPGEPAAKFRRGRGWL